VGDFVPGFVAKSIWSSGGQFSTTETEIWGRSHFFLNELPFTAQLNGAFDDDGDIFINGALVISNHDGVAGGFNVLDLLPFLVAGDNLIAFSATDNFPVFGFNHQAWVQIDGVVQQTPLPAAFPLMFSALGVLGFMRRRSKK
jgi:hypothetical protein